MRPERTERVVQTSVQNQACDDARQKGVPVCLRPGPGEDDFVGHSVGGRDEVCSILLFRLLVEFLQWRTVRWCAQFRSDTGIHNRSHDPPTLKHSNITIMTFPGARIH